MTMSPHVSPYDAIAELYDPWSVSVVEDVGFYLDEARRSGGPVVDTMIDRGMAELSIMHRSASGADALRAFRGRGGLWFGCGL